jgi:hypothetical protein
MRSIGFWVLLLTIFIGCKNKKKEEVDNSNYWPIRSYLQGQVKMLDSTMFSITKIVTENGVSDSMPLPRDSVRGLAKEFLNIPDLRSEEGKSYTEVNDYDTTTTMGSWTYSSEKSEVPKMQVFFVKSASNFNDLITTIYIEKEIAKGDSLVLKRLLWDVVEHYFQERTIVSKKNSPDKIRDVRVTWQDFASN